MSGNRVNQDFEVESSGMDDSRLNHRVGSVVCAVFVAVTFFPLWFFAVLAAFSLKPRLLFLAGQQQDHEIALQAFGRVLTIVCVSGIVAAALVAWLTFWILDRNYSTRRIPLVR